MFSQSSYRPFAIIQVSIDMHIIFFFLLIAFALRFVMDFLISTPFLKPIRIERDLAPSCHFMQREQNKSKCIWISNLGSFSWFNQLNSHIEAHLKKKESEIIRLEIKCYKSTFVHVFIIYCRRFGFCVLLFGKPVFDVASQTRIFRSFFSS